MDLRLILDRFRKEHEEIWCFSNRWEAAINSTASANEGQRWTGLAQLRAVEKELLRIRDHCRAEELDPESPFLLYLKDADWEELRNQHELLERRIGDFNSELLFATTERTEQLVHLGRQLLHLLRQHIGFEDGLLKQLQDASVAEKIVSRSVSQR